VINIELGISPHAIETALALQAVTYKMPLGFMSRLVKLKHFGTYTIGKLYV
jgi:hypothetical protein